MNKIYTVAFLFITIISTAQTKDKTKTLEVVGSANMSIAPDVGVLNIHVNEIDMLFSESIKGLNKKSQDITNQLKKIGFDQSAIRTEDFDIRKNRVYRNRQTIDSGYVATQLIHLEFKNDQKNITKLLNQFARSSTEFNLNFNFKLSDSLKEKVQKQLIKLATQNAFNKAKLICEAAKIDIEKVSKISYGNSFNGGMRVYNNNQQLNEIVITAPRSKLKGFTPKNLVYTDAILVIWDLK